MSFKSIDISGGVSILNISDDRFKTNLLSVVFLTPLDREAVSKNAIIPQLLRRRCAAYPDFTALNMRLNELYGARLSADVSRIGDYQLLTLSVAAIDDRYALNGESVMGDCADLLSNILFKPYFEDGLFSDEDFSQERRQLIEEIQSEINEKRMYARIRASEIMCEGEPCSIHPLGKQSDAEVLTREAVTEQYKTLLKTAFVKIMMIGGADSAGISEKFKSAFAKIKREPITLKPSLVKSGVESIREATERMELSQAKLVLGFRTGVSIPDGDTVALKLMTALLGGTPHSRFFVNVREKLSLCYYCAAGADKLNGVVTVDSGLEEDNKEKAVAEILRQIEIVQRGEFEDDELIATKMSLSNSFMTATDSQGSLLSFYLGQIMDKELYSPEQMADMITSVQKDRVVEAAKKLVLDTVYLLAGKE